MHQDRLVRPLLREIRPYATHRLVFWLQLPSPTLPPASRTSLPEWAMPVLPALPLGLREERQQRLSELAFRPSPEQVPRVCPLPRRVSCWKRAPDSTPSRW